MRADDDATPAPGHADHADASAPAVYGHLGLEVAAYDEAIVRFIPHYRELLDTAAAWLVGAVPAGGLVLDLGAGTGALAAAVLAALPTARVELIDGDAGMLAAARHRLAGDAARVTTRVADFFDPLPRCHGVVASLAFHHVADPDAKLRLYRAIHAALEPGGALWIADCVLHPDGAGERRFRAGWADEMQRRGLSAAEAAACFVRWDAEDRYLPLTVELPLLAAAGFARPDCVWRRGPCAVYGGFRE